MNNEADTVTLMCASETIEIPHAILKIIVLSAAHRLREQMYDDIEHAKTADSAESFGDSLNILEDATASHRVNYRAHELADAIHTWLDQLPPF